MRQFQIAGVGLQLAGLDLAGYLGDRSIGWCRNTAAVEFLDHQSIDHVDFTIAALQMILQNAVARRWSHILSQFIEHLIEQIIGVFDVVWRQTKYRLHRIAQLLTGRQRLGANT